MNKNLKMWSVDHGNRKLKAYNGKMEIICDNGLIKKQSRLSDDETVEYEGSCYLVGGRTKYKYDKTVDREFFISTLKIFGMFLESEGIFETKCYLAVGLPIPDGILKEKYIKYFGNNQEWVEFKYNGRFYRVKILEVFCFYQSLSAYALQYSSYNNTYLKELYSYNICDIGWFTTDIIRIVGNKPDLKSATSMSNGILKLVVEIKDQLKRLKGITMNEDQIEEILKNGDDLYVDEVINEVINDCSMKYVLELQRDLEEIGIETQYSGNILIGGGGEFMYDALLKVPANLNKMTLFFKVDNCTTANTRGYYYLMSQILKRREKIEQT